MASRVRPFSKMLLLGLVAFLLLSGIDFFLTWKLIATENSEVDEVNPVAAWVLGNFGWSGMAAYKLGLVTCIAGAILAIAWRKPRAGESVLVFGCGAQAAIVVTSLLLLRGNQPDDSAQKNVIPVLGRLDDGVQSLPPGAMLLLTQSAVQKELQLSTEVMFNVQLMTNQRFDLRHKIRDENLSDWYVYFHDQLGQERALANFLTAKQTKRLTELSLQLRGPFAFWDADVMEAIGLRDEQITKMDAIREDAKMDAPAVRGQRRSNLALRPSANGFDGTKSQLWAVLDASQKQQWKQLLGQPFTFEAQAASGAEAQPWSVTD